MLKILNLFSYGVVKELHAMVDGIGELVKAILVDGHLRDAKVSRELGAGLRSNNGVGDNGDC